MKDRQGFVSVTDIDIHSIKFNVIKGMPSAESIFYEREALLDHKLLKEGTGLEMHNANELF
jgi:hypothetical protein